MRLFPLKVTAPTSPAVNPHAANLHALPERSCHERSCHENVPYEQYLAEQLHCRLLDLDFPAFAFCVCRLLEALGYQDVHLAGRREWKGYNKPGGGGYDLEATLPGSLLPGSLSSRRIIAQIKQFDGLRVHQRSVDELRGACLRVGAAEALLITTSAFSQVARAGAATPGGAISLVAPVRLIDGEELAALLIRHQIGVKECKLKKCKISARNRGLARLPRLGNKASTDDKLAEKQWEIDDAFFAELALASTILGKAPPTNLGKAPPTKHQNPSKRQSPTTPPNSTPRQNLMKQNLTQWRVTVRISTNAEDEQKKGHQKEGHQKGGD